MDHDSLEDDFPLGDGVADTEAVTHCPYCGEAIVIAIDPDGGSTQEYVEDCAVCCQPWQVLVSYHDDGSADVTVAAVDE